ncbi:hypothetical protein LCGC14_0758160 [marine sediment metagenome]|uniref:Uncharacterized protein n=1 Tax=marine sediment metagenome TaxID=412755 RepID=A0A0F9Q647_9ZZZZ
MKRAEFLKLAGVTAGAIVAGVSALPRVRIFRKNRLLSICTVPKEPYTDKDMVIPIDQFDNIRGDKIVIPFSYFGRRALELPIIEDSKGKRIAVVPYEKLVEIGYRQRG